MLFIVCLCAILTWYTPVYSLTLSPSLMPLALKASARPK